MKPNFNRNQKAEMIDGKQTLKYNILMLFLS